MRTIDFGHPDFDFALAAFPIVFGIQMDDMTHLDESGVEPAGGEVQRGYCEDTPNGGVHWFYRSTDVGGSTKLARRPKTKDERRNERDLVKTLIETKGAGSYIIVAPSHGRVHETGRPYQLRSGGFATIGTITPDERRSLLQLAGTFDQMPCREWREPRRAGNTADGDRPGDEFAARRSWTEIL